VLLAIPSSSPDPDTDGGLDDCRRRERARSASVLSGRPGSAMGLYSGAGAFDTEVECKSRQLRCGRLIQSDHSHIDCSARA
jgi:hypothetical protein